jgi:hypothetical protein
MAKAAKKPQPKPAPRRKLLGRPSDYCPEFAGQAAKLCELGATEFDLSEFFKVSLPTIWRWRTSIPEFCSAVAVGKNTADDRAEMSLYHRAIGYSYNSEKVFQFQGEIIRAPIVEHVPPDVGALSLWLKNRRPKEWRDRSEVEHNHVVTLAELVSMSYREDLPALPVPKIIEGKEE